MERRKLQTSSPGFLFFPSFEGIETLGKGLGDFNSRRSQDLRSLQHGYGLKVENTEEAQSSIFFPRRLHKSQNTQAGD